MKSPVLPGLYADPNISVVGDTFWIHPTTDGFAGWSGTQIKAFSSKDLVHWTDHEPARDRSVKYRVRVVATQDGSTATAKSIRDRGAKR